MKGHDRPEGNGLPGDFIRRPQSVQGDPGPNQIETGVRQTDDPCTVGDVTERDPISQLLFYPFCKSKKALQLSIGIRKVSFISLGKVGENTFQGEQALLLELQSTADKRQPSVIRCDPDPAHAGVDSDVDADRTLHFSSRGGQLFQHVLPETGGTYTQLCQILVTVGKSIPQDQDRLLYTCLPEFHGLLKGRNRKSPQIGKGFDPVGDGHSAVPVTVRLYDCDHAGVRKKIPVHAFHIVASGGEVDLCTYPFVTHLLLVSCFMIFFLLRHVCYGMSAGPVLQKAAFSSMACLRILCSRKLLCEAPR